jgi:uncharacterized membrane protein
MAAASPSSLKWPGFLLGFSLGGFYDGILLHQILQWHHLLSNVNAVQDMRMQVMADGLFHALMYVIAAVALMKLWRSRAAANEPGASGRLWGYALIGFGVWHIADSVFSHWITGIHRIKIESPDPLLWDLIWFFVFGVLPAIIGWRMLPNKGAHTGGGGGGRAAAATLGLSALIAGPIAAVPAASDPTQIVVLFAPGVSSNQAFNALARVDARVLWVDRWGGMWAVKMDNPSAAWQLYRTGAMLVSNTGFSLGCFSWTKPKAT